MRLEVSRIIEIRVLGPRFGGPRVQIWGLEVQNQRSWRSKSLWERKSAKTRTDDGKFIALFPKIIGGLEGEKHENVEKKEWFYFCRGFRKQLLEVSVFSIFEWFRIEDLSRRGQMGRGSGDPRLIQGTGHHNMRQFLTKVGQKPPLEGWNQAH